MVTHTPVGEISEEVVREVLAAVVTNEPCTFPQAFVDNHRMNVLVEPDQIKPDVVFRIMRTMGRVD